MPTLNIKDPEVYRLASELARRRGTSMTAVVRELLEAATEEESRRREGRFERVMAIAEESAREIKEHGIVFLTDDDLYDEDGLPR
jgi:antitoxin VapB